MNKLLLSLVIVFSVSCGKAQSETKNKKENTTKTTYYFMRHAEKNVKGGNNPKLTKEGHQRSKRLANYFKNKKLNAVYSTKFNRTINTAKPTANTQGLKIIIYNPAKLDYDAFINDTKGKTVLVVGHSNTIPGFVNKVIGENKYKEIDERKYSNLYIVTIKNNVIEDELISQD